VALIFPRCSRELTSAIGGAHFWVNLEKQTDALIAVMDYIGLDQFIHSPVQICLSVNATHGADSIVWA